MLPYFILEMRFVDSLSLFINGGDEKDFLVQLNPGIIHFGYLLSCVFPLDPILSKGHFGGSFFI